MNGTLFAAIAEAVEETPEQRHQQRRAEVFRHYVTHRRSVRFCAEELRLPEHEVVSLLEEMGVELRTNRPRRKGIRRPIDEAAMARVLAIEYRSGVSINDLALKYHLGKARTRALIESTGQQIRPVGAVTKVNDVALHGTIAGMYAEGKTYAQIKELLDVSHYRIAKALDALGVQARPHGDKPRQPPGPLPPDIIARLVRRYCEEKVGLVVLSKEERIDIARVRRALVEAGVRIRGSGRRAGVPNRTRI